MIIVKHNRFFFTKQLLLFCLVVNAPNYGFSQQQNVPINYFISQKIEKNAQNAENLVHTAVKPFQQNFLSKKTYDAVFEDTNLYYYDFTQKLFKENLLFIKEKDVLLVADPLFNFGIGNSAYNNTTSNYLTNTRGVRVAGNITSKFSFETRYYENQFYYPQYLDSIADARGVAFGLGRAKAFKSNGYDVGMSSGYISYSPIKALNIQFGQGKHFFGNGYRSLLLSDNAFNYPYLSFTVNLWKGKVFYKNINAWMQTIERIPVSSTPEALFKRKNGSFRYLSFKPHKKIEIGLFEGVIYKKYQDSVGEIAVNPAFYIPIIGVSSGMNANNDENKVLLGVNLNVSPVDAVKIYGQFVLDDFSKTGFQIGGKWFAPFKLSNSWIMVEYNSASSYLYTQSNTNIIQNYSNANQELASPLGASFNEIVTMAHFEMNRYFVTAKFFNATKLREGGGLSGENIFLPNDAILPAIAPEKVNWNYFGGEFGYEFNVKTKMQIFGSVYSRSESGNNWSNNEWFWQFGLRTTLNNIYYEQ